MMAEERRQLLDNATCPICGMGMNILTYLIPQHGECNNKDEGLYCFHCDKCGFSLCQHDMTIIPIIEKRLYEFIKKYGSPMALDGLRGYEYGIYLKESGIR